MDARCAEGGEKADKNRVKPAASLVLRRRPWYFRIMTLRGESLPSDPALLTELALALRAENESLRTTISTLKALIFGAHSERLSTIGAEQLVLALVEGDGDTPPGPVGSDASAGFSKKPRKKAERNIGKLPEHLPRCERVIEPSTTHCPCCNGKMRRIGEDVTETLDRIPATLRVLRTIRPKYACRACDSGVAQAPAPARLIEGGVDRGEFRKVEPDRTALFLWGAWNGVIGLTLRKDPLRLDRKHLKGLLRFGTELIEQGLTAV